jgi:RNA polymerase sigma-70 factor (ECF subfamily)
MGSMTETNVDIPVSPEDQSGAPHDALFERLAMEYAAPLTRVARAHEADAALQKDLLQEIHIALWRSLPAFGGRCSLRTWVYRVAHNVAATHVLRHKRIAQNLVSLDDIDIASESRGLEVQAGDAQLIARLHALVQRLKPLDREVFVLYLEGLSVDEIAEIAGLSHTNTGTKLHRIRALLCKQLRTGEEA